jgi:alpha-beta hydrolase superfamily lysophospholipase
MSMSRRTRSLIVIGLAALVLGGYALATTVVPAIAAGGLLHPLRRACGQPRPAMCGDVLFDGVSVKLAGWQCRRAEPARASLVFLHGVADNRGSASGLVERFVGEGFDVVAYDSRAHGDSTGEVCTYGYWEKKDLEKVLDTLRPGPVVLLGTSLGAAVALQTAAEDRRVSAVVAAEVFSDLRTAARERAPRLLTEGAIARAFAIAESQGAFRVDAVSPVEAARTIHVPVLLIHGAEDTDTPPKHSRRVFGALAGPKQLLLVKDARHNESLRREETWRRIDAWLKEVLPPGA